MPGATRPRSGASIRSALTVVAARMAPSGVMPRFTRVTNSSALRPCQMAGASLPVAIFTPASMALEMVWRALGNTSAAFAWSSGGWLDTSQFSVSAVVLTKKVPVSTMSWMVSSSIKKPCSMQSMPASMAERTASSPWQWVATLSPRRWASSAMAVNSSVEYCCAPAGPVCDITPPEPQHLISWAPYLIWYRTARRISSMPSATPSSTVIGRASGARAWNMVGSRWPPVGVMACPAGTIRGPSTQPASMASPRATSSRYPPVFTKRPRFRTVVNPALRVRRALAVARNVILAGLVCTGSNSPAPGPPMKKLTSMSMNPGKRVSSGSSITSSQSLAMPLSAPTSAMRLPSTRTKPGSMMSPVSMSSTPRPCRAVAVGSGMARPFRLCGMCLR